MNIRRQKERQTCKQDIPTSPDDSISREIYVIDNLIEHSFNEAESDIKKFILSFLVHSSIF